MSKINSEFSTELTKLGCPVDLNVCFNCGNCSAICPLSEGENSFPRKIIRASILGVEDDIKTSLDPWMCYYCGECSETCPQEANPGELMMSLRRWLTTKYDWTGLSWKFYTSKKWEFSAIILLAAFVFFLFALLNGIPLSTDKTFINEIAPWRIVEIGDWIMAGVLAALLISFIFNMHRMIIIKDKTIKVPLKLYFTEFWTLIFHFASQWRFSDCEIKIQSFWKKLCAGKYNYWIAHWLLMSGYVLLFTMIVIFLEWFQTDTIYPWWYPQRLFGYYATFGLIFGTVYFIIHRIKKDRENSKHSHITDWTFIILLLLSAVSGILMHISRINQSPLLVTYYLYVVHLMIVVPMLCIEVPFSKWSHLAYRPFAIYFNNIKMAARELVKKQSNSTAN
ncbi:MAG: 4Fe-4S dicluster domain-containing protein [Bacteroidales bacterium]|nr:4Fe-4S dicluster domain-containing protein [Bacteroidales bacterium]